MKHQSNQVGLLEPGRIHLEGLVLAVPVPLINRLNLRKGDRVIIAPHGGQTVLTFHRHQLAPCVLVIDAHHTLIEARGLDGKLIPPTLWHVEPQKALQ